jgi:hypothetical protein
MKAYRIRPSNAKQDFIAVNLDIAIVEISLLLESGCEQLHIESYDIDDSKWKQLEKFTGYETETGG